MTDIVKFNIGGVLYQVSRALLESFPDSMLSTSASMQWQQHSDKEEEIFMDRDGSKFSHVLDFMRDGEVYLPVNVTKEAILKELEYYSFGNVDENCIHDCVSNGSFQYSNGVAKMQAFMARLDREEESFVDEYNCLIMSKCIINDHLRFDWNSGPHYDLDISMNAAISAPLTKLKSGCNKYLNQVGLSLVNIELLDQTTARSTSGASSSFGQFGNKAPGADTFDLKPKATSTSDTGSFASSNGFGTASSSAGFNSNAPTWTTTSGGFQNGFGSGSGEKRKSSGSESFGSSYGFASPSGSQFNSNAPSYIPSAAVVAAAQAQSNSNVGTSAFASAQPAPSSGTFGSSYGFSAPAPTTQFDRNAPSTTTTTATTSTHLQSSSSGVASSTKTSLFGTTTTSTAADNLGSSSGFSSGNHFNSSHVPTSAINDSGTRTAATADTSLRGSSKCLYKVKLELLK